MGMATLHERAVFFFFSTSCRYPLFFPLLIPFPFFLAAFLSSARELSPCVCLFRLFHHATTSVLTHSFVPALNLLLCYPLVSAV